MGITRGQLHPTDPHSTQRSYYTGSDGNPECLCIAAYDGKRSLAIQTDTAVVIQTDAELQEIQTRGVTRNCECGDLRKENELVNKKLDLAVDILKSFKDRNTSATALVDSIMKGSGNTTVLELPAQQAIVRLIS